MFPKIVGVPPRPSILIGFSIRNHPFWGTVPIFGNTHITVVKNWQIHLQILIISCCVIWIAVHVRTSAGLRRHVREIVCIASYFFACCKVSFALTCFCSSSCSFSRLD